MTVGVAVPVTDREVVPVEDTVAVTERADRVPEAVAVTDCSDREPVEETVEDTVEELVAVEEEVPHSAETDDEPVAELEPVLLGVAVKLFSTVLLGEVVVVAVLLKEPKVFELVLLTVLDAVAVAVTVAVALNERKLREGVSVAEAEEEAVEEEVPHSAETDDEPVAELEPVQLGVAVLLNVGEPVAELVGLFTRVLLGEKVAVVLEVAVGVPVGKKVLELLAVPLEELLIVATAVTVGDPVPLLEEVAVEEKDGFEAAADTLAFPETVAVPLAVKESFVFVAVTERAEPLAVPERVAEAVGLHWDVDVREFAAERVGVSVDEDVAEAVLCRRRARGGASGA